MADMLQGYFITAFEVMCCKVFFDTFTRSTSIHKQRDFWLFFGMSLIDLFCAIFLAQHFLIKEIVVILANTVVFRVYSMVSVKKCVVLSMLFQGLLIGVEFLMLGFQSVFLPDISVDSRLTGVLLVVLSKAFLLLVIIMLRACFSKKEFRLLHDEEWIKLVFIPLFTIGMITAMLSKNTYSIKYQYDVLFLVISLGLIGMNLSVFFMINDIVLREKHVREYERLELDAKNKLHLYESLSKSVDTQRSLSHEFHNQLEVIQGLFENKEYEALEGYLSEVNAMYLGEGSRFETNHAIVNAVLNVKYHEALEQEILMVCQIGDLGKLWLRDEDVALVLSNVLNNAIEACQKCSEHRYIKLKMVIEGDELILSVKNPCAEMVREKDGEFFSTKRENREQHGYGIRNVRRVVEKYRGDVECAVRDGSFMIVIRIVAQLKPSDFNRITV